MAFEATKVASEVRMALQELSRHLGDLKQVKKDLEARKREAKGFIEDSLRATIATIDKPIKATEEALEKEIEKEEGLKEDLELLRSIPGVGTPTATMLLSYLKELGKATPKEIGALSGLAPMNNDSGTMKGKRRIRGGRKDVRVNLYMLILGAVTRHNKRLKEIYDRLVAMGKAKKIALTACMRKLVIWANAILATRKPWCENNR